jgi:hypothetical protein
MTEHKNVFVALAAAQSEMESVVKGSVNPAFKSRYAALDDVVQVVRPALNKHGIAYFHQIVTDERGSVMRTVLWHGASDTHVTCDVPLIVDRNNMQGFKSATTYAKRIGVESLTGIAPQDDDDGNAAAKAAPKDEKPAVRPELQHGEAIRDAWKDGVLDSLPEDATPRQKAEAFAKAIADDFKGKGEKALHNAWSRHAKLIERLQQDHPDLHEMIGDAFDVRLNELTDSKGIAAQ